MNTVDRDYESRMIKMAQFGEDESKAKIFVRVQRVIIELLAVDESEINLDSHMSNHLKADELDLFEIVVALEEEFDIEMSDDSADFCSSIGAFKWSSDSGTSSLSLSFTAGEECSVRSFVELIYKIISDC